MTLRAPSCCAIVLAICSIVFAGCSSDTSSDEGVSSDDGASTGVASSSTADGGTDEGSSTTGDPSTTTSGGPSTSTPDPQTETCANDCDSEGNSARPCEVVAQDCPEGQKCTPYASGGDLKRDSTQCIDVADPAQPAGEACQVEEWPASGLDNCDSTSMCFNVDENTLEGTCKAFCAGNSWPYTCEDPLAHCLLANDMLIAVCVRDCDPLKQDCAEGQACYPTEEGTYECGWDQSGMAGQYQSVCTSHHDCAAGRLCVPSEFVYDCEAERCCTDYCPLDSEELDDEPCPDTEKGMTCLGLYQALDVPASNQAFGACLLAP